MDSRPQARPGIFSVEARSKYDAWVETDNMTKQEARDAYFKLAEDLVGKPVTDLKK
jgi:acyl-CoA-binding protein